MLMRVKAVQPGFDGMQRRKVGEVFELELQKPPREDSWVELVEETVPVSKPPVAKAAARKPVGMSQIQKGANPHESDSVI